MVIVIGVMYNIRKGQSQAGKDMSAELAQADISAHLTSEANPKSFDFRVSARRPAEIMSGALFNPAGGRITIHGRGGE